MLLGLLIVLIAFVGIMALSILTIRADRSGKGRAMTSAMLDPFNQVADPSKRAAAAYIEQMTVGHDKENEGEGDEPPEAEDGDSFERDLQRQMGSLDSDLKRRWATSEDSAIFAPQEVAHRRGARGKPPDSGARL